LPEQGLPAGQSISDFVRCFSTIELFNRRQKKQGKKGGMGRNEEERRVEG
jgi:hypothetical protein